VDEVLAELEAMAREGARPMRSGPKPPLAGAALQKILSQISLVREFKPASGATYSASE
jgi:hypothetical protein